MMSDQEPPSKRAKQTSSLQIKLKNASDGEKKLIIKHPSLSRATGCSLDSDVGQFQIFCGGIRIKITEDEGHQGVAEQVQIKTDPTEKAAHATEEGSSITAEGSQSSPKHPASVSPVSLTYLKQMDDPPSITVTLENDRGNTIGWDFPRYFRVEQVIEVYAFAMSLKKEDLSVYHGFKRLPLPRRERLGTFVKRSTKVLHLKVVDDTEELSDGYSVYWDSE